MGTRNLTCVYADGEYKLAQYGQWDGDPPVQGARVHEFLKNLKDYDKLKEILSKCRNVSEYEISEIKKSFMKNKSMPGLNITEYDNFSEAYPQFSRDTGARILNYIMEHPDGLDLYNEIEFAADSLYCEWAYVIDLDAKKLEIYIGFNTTPLTKEDRFYDLDQSLPKDSEYRAIKLLKAYFFDKLPDLDDYIDELMTLFEATREDDEF